MTSKQFWFFVVLVFVVMIMVGYFETPH